MKKRIFAIIAVLLISTNIFANTTYQKPKAAAGVALTLGVILYGIISTMMLNGDTVVEGTEGLFDCAKDLSENFADGIAYMQTDEGKKYIQDTYGDGTYNAYLDLATTADSMIDPNATTDSFKIKYQDYIKLCQIAKGHITIPGQIQTTYATVTQNLSDEYNPYYYMKMGEDVTLIPYIIKNGVLYICSVQSIWDYQGRYTSGSYEFYGTMKVSYNYKRIDGDYQGIYILSMHNISFSLIQNAMAYGMFIDKDGNYNFNRKTYYNGKYIDSLYKTSDYYFFDIKTNNIAEYSVNYEQGYIIAPEYPTMIDYEYKPGDVNTLNDELETILPITDNPSLVINPASDDIIDDIIVTDVPGIDDITIGELSQGLALNTTFDVVTPDILFTKFPFSLPWDFYRLITIFEATPKEPVFDVSLNNTYGAGEGYILYDENGVPHYYNARDEEILFIIDESVTFDLTEIPYIRLLSHISCYVGAVLTMIFLTNKLTARGH